MGWRGGFRNAFGPAPLFFRKSIVSPMRLPLLNPNPNRNRRSGVGSGVRLGLGVRILTALLALWIASGVTRAADTPRQIIAQATIEEDDEKKVELINSLIGNTDPIIRTLFGAWRQ